MLRALVVLAVYALWAFAGTASAWGHATLVASTPANDAVLKSAPTSVSLRFDEPVETVFGALRVFDASGRRIDSGALRKPRGDTIVVSLNGALPRGSYTVAWRVISGDTHPVHGAFVFSVGARDAGGQAEAARIEAGKATPRSVSVGFGVARFVALLSCSRARGSDRARARAGGHGGPGRAADRRGRAWLLPASLVGLVYEAASAGGFGLREAADPSVVRRSRDAFGTVWAVRAGLAILLVAVLLAGRRSHRRTRRG